jgi:hypothetical protein
VGIEAKMSPLLSDGDISLNHLTIPAVARGIGTKSDVTD